MIIIIGITLIICIAAIRLGGTKRSEITNVKAKRLRQISANSAVVRHQISEEQKLRREEQRELNKELQLYKERHQFAPVHKKIVAISPMSVPAKSPIMAGGGGGNGEGESPPETFSPSKWWDKNYAKVEQVDEETLRVDDSFLPTDRKLWADIGKYLLDSGEFSDFQINDRNITLKI